MSAMASLKQSWAEAMAPLRQRWALLEEREQRALLILGIALFLFLLWGFWMASHRAALKAEQQLTQARAVLRELQQAAPAAGNLAVAGGSVLRAASDAAAAGGLALNRIEPEGETRVRVWLEKADFNAVATWLAALSRQGIRVEEAQVEKLADGGVSARLALAR
jgi:general secretion pathway protein M